MARFVAIALAAFCVDFAVAQYGSSHGGISGSPYGGGLSSFGSSGLGGLGGLGSGLYDDGLYGSSSMGSNLGGYGLGPLYGSSFPSRGNTFPLTGALGSPYSSSLGSPYGSPLGSSLGSPYGSPLGSSYGSSGMGSIYGSGNGLSSGLYGGGLSPYGSLSSPLGASRLSGLGGGSIYDSFPYATRK